MRLGHPFEVLSPTVDEAREPGEAPRMMASRLARLKAHAVAAQAADAWVVGSDQVIALGETVLYKPGTAERACVQLAQLSGQTHQLVTAVCVVAPGGLEAFDMMTHEMTMRPLSAAEIERYVAEDEPFDCAGSYKVESGGIRLFTSLRGDDYTGIVGLPLTMVRRLLDQLHFDWGSP